MLTKNELKYYASLLKKKYRDEYNKFLAEGIKILEEGLASNYNCELVFLTHQFKDSHQDLFEELSSNDLRIEILKNPEFSKLSDTVNPQGITAVFSKPEKYLMDKIESNLFCGLENISDPGNVGTIVRNCDWFGIRDLILSENCADIFNPKAIRASMGSIFHINLHESKNFLADLENLKKNNYQLLCADLNGKNVFNYESKAKSLIIFANEANGPTHELVNLVDDSLTIPKLGNAESLNVASASAIILSQLTLYKG